MKLRQALLLSSILFGLAHPMATAQESDAAEPAPRADTTDVEAEKDDTRVLNTVNITRSRGAPAPNTGRLIMAVDVLPTSRRIRTAAGVAGLRQVRAATTVQSYSLSMRGIDFPADGGDPVLRNLEDGPRNFEYVGDSSEGRFIAFDLAPGYYILSNIRFDIATLESSQIDPFNGDFTTPNNSPALAASFNSSRNSVNYCVNEKTVVFEVVEGLTSYFGYLQLAEPPGNRAQLADHTPIIGYEQDLDVLQDNSNWDDRTEADIHETPLKIISFDPTGETCQLENAHRVSGWEGSGSTGSAEKLL